MFIRSEKYLFVFMLCSFALYGQVLGVGGSILR
jgi:hypothetical protein